MFEFGVALFIIVCIGSMALHIFSLPANWVLLALLAGWNWAHPGFMTWSFFGLLVALAVAGEFIELMAQARSARKYGASNKGNFGGIIGAIVGAILGASFLLGLGALIGALAGAYGGCLLVELLHGRSMEEARRAAWGAMYGKFFGFTVKLGLGIGILALSIPKLFA